MRTFRQHRPTSWRRPHGFTLIEAAIVTAIVGFGIVGLLQLLAAGTLANTESTELTTAMGLAANVHEMTVSIPYTSLMTTMGNKDYKPPVDSKGFQITDLKNWEQRVGVSYVDQNRLSFDVPSTSSSPVSRVTVTILHNNRMIYTTSWLAAASVWPPP